MLCLCSLGCLFEMVRCSIIVVLLVLSLQTHAIQVEGLYSAKVAMADQSAVARKQAINDALYKVIQKVSGRRSSLSDPSFLAALSNTGSYVQQFQYEKRIETEQATSAYWLIVKFQKAALDRVMRQFDVPIWGSNRPDVLMWLAVKEDGHRFLVGSDGGPMAASAKQLSSDAGLAAMLPMLDLEDQRTVSFNDVWGGFQENILFSSKRYGAKQVLFGQLLKSENDSWRFSWTFSDGKTQFSETEHLARLDDALTSAFEKVAESLADIYAPRGGVKNTTVIFEVSGVQDLAHFAQVTQYLLSLDRVKKVDWEQLVDNSAVLELSVTGEVTVLRDIIALNDVLSPESRLQVATKFNVELQPIQSQQFKQTFYYRAN